MPVTAKLSREFYEKFGDKIADEFVNWFNQVDATYRSEFKDLFEAHFPRLESKLEQRLAQFDAKLERRLGEQTRWLFGTWAIVLAAVIGLWFRR